ncbi:retention module-containing protein [Vibrio anguillarum]
MDLQVVVQPASVSEVVGDVIAVDAKGNARQVTVGDSLMKGEILITVNHSSVTLFINGQVAVVEQNCVACFGDTVLEHYTSIESSFLSRATLTLISPNLMRPILMRII